MGFAPQKINKPKKTTTKKQATEPKQFSPPAPGPPCLGHAPASLDRCHGPLSGLPSPALDPSNLFSTQPVLGTLLRPLSHVRFCAIPWTGAHQAPLSMGFSRQEYWSGLPFPTSGDFPHPESKPESLESCALAGEFFTTETRIPFKMQTSSCHFHLTPPP